MRNWKKIVGTVVSTAMVRRRRGGGSWRDTYRTRRRPRAQDKTAKVEVQSFYVHSKYGKLMKRRRNFFAHDEHNLCGVGDHVQIKFVGKMSKKKQWAVIDMLHRHPQLGGESFPMSKLSGSPAEYPPVHPADAAHPQRAALQAEAAANGR